MYDSFSCVYDTLMSDADYDGRTEYICDIFKKFGKAPTLLLDLCCGTGSFSVRFAKKGIGVIGADISPDMLDCARKRSAETNTDVLYLCQDAAELDLFGTVDGAICCLDSINHITDPEQLQCVFNKVSLFLEPDCLFIFDVNTPYKHKEVLADNTFVIESGNVYCVWQNSYFEEDKITEINLDFFTEENGVYKRSSQFIEERAYGLEEIKGMLLKAGFETIAVYRDMSFEPVTEDCERAVFAALKKV